MIIQTVALLILKLGITFGVQTLLVRCLRKHDFILGKFYWFVFLLLNLEWVGRIFRFPNAIQTYVEHLRESKILGTSPHFPFSILESVLFILFYTVFAMKIFRWSRAHLKFWVRGLQTVIVFGICIHLYGIYLESIEVTDELLRNTNSDWIYVWVKFVLNTAVAVCFCRLLGLFRLRLKAPKKI